MSQEILNIIYSALGVIVTALVSWGVKVFTDWLNNKIKDQKVNKWATDVTNIVTDAVMAVMQTFVDTLKKNNTFDEKAAKEAKEKCLTIIKSQLTPDLISYIETNYGDMEEWLSNKIEAVLYTVKNNRDVE